MTVSLRADQARRLALAAQGFDRPRPASVSTRHILGLVRRLGLLQLDSVNVFCRSHYVPVFSRLGPYDLALLDRLAGHGVGSRRGRRLFEYWAHEASLVPFELHPLLRWRMAQVDTAAWRSIARVAHESPELIEEVEALVASDGPIRAGATGFVRPAPGPDAMWNWHDGKRALEHLFFSGRVTAAGRVNFERLYDLPERVLPPVVLESPTPDPADAQRELIRISARALGVAAEPDLGDYFRLPRTDSKARVAELVSAGELQAVEVEGWRVPGYLWPEATLPRRLHARALLSPFDPLVWNRDRALRLFGFHYRIEIYTPAPQRVYGYYVLPFLLGDRLVARVDLKSDRAAGVLRVRGAFAEQGVDPEAVAVELAAELWLAAGWLGLGQVEVENRGDLARALQAASANCRVESAPQGA
ncbi:MAG TPA: crosslink repair DNA glycosylase YcaQ family protein [Solirubrobacteraceae bacterium]|jgi:hypothetical protein|nr:crosslink repair DNA glycosylase YcaQ family protein [Solirubrobacteraceae bacterium]